MSEYENQNNNLNNQQNNNMNRPDQSGKVPEYNFWAEQMQSGPYSNYNQGPDYRSYGPTPPNNNMDTGRRPKKKGKGRKAFQFFAKALCFGIIAAVSFFGVHQLYYAIYPANDNKYALSTSDNQSSTDKSAANYKIEATRPGSVKVQPRSVITDVVNETMPSIVSITGVVTQTNFWFGQSYNQPAQTSGSGIIVGKNDDELLIATNNHVVEGAQDITVTFTGSKDAKAEIKGTDATADLAVITVKLSELDQDTQNAIKLAKLGNSDKLKVGEMSIAIGNALGYGQSVTVGYISAKEREVDVSDGYESKKMVLLQTDAAINPGNSGGALINPDGEVIGINTVKYADEEVEGMGYAIPITKATPIINELMSREVLKPEEQGYLGIAGGDVTEEDSKAYNIPVGVFVNEVPEKGAAYKAGILKGDVITRVNDIEITSITQLKDYVNSLRIGTKVQITLMRNENGAYQEKVISVTLAASPDASASSTD